MLNPTHPIPSQSGNGAAMVLLGATLGALALAALVTVVPVQLGGVALLAVLLAVVGLVAGTLIEGGAR